jgi:hypothetical protein
VQLNPRNMDALSDLFEYYLEAPGFMGGGLDKAAGVAVGWRHRPRRGALGAGPPGREAKEFGSAEEHCKRARWRRSRPAG